MAQFVKNKQSRAVMDHKPKKTSGYFLSEGTATMRELHEARKDNTQKCSRLRSVALFVWEAVLRDGFGSYRNAQQLADRIRIANRQSSFRALNSNGSRPNSQGVYGDLEH